MITIKIYTLTNPLNGSVFYVGKTADMEARFLHHLSSAIKNDRPKDILIKEMILSGKHPIMEEIDSYDCKYQDDEDAATDLELYWIHQFKSWGFNLTNSDGVTKKHNFSRRFSNVLEKPIEQRLIELIGKESDRLEKIRKEVMESASLTDKQKVSLKNRISEQYSDFVINMLLAIKAPEMAVDWIEKNDLVYYENENRYIFKKNNPNIRQSVEEI